MSFKIIWRNDPPRDDNKTEIVREWWDRSVTAAGTSATFIHNATTLAGRYDLTGTQLNNLVNEYSQLVQDFTCDTCRKDWQRAWRRISRSAYHAAIKRPDTICDECKAAAHEEQLRKARQESEEAAALAKVERDANREKAKAKYGVRFYGDCDKCGEGFIVIRYNSHSGEPFLGCSTWSPYRRSCDYHATLPERERAERESDLDFIFAEGTAA
jgi:hypothetical protein